MGYWLISIYNFSFICFLLKIGSLIISFISVVAYLFQHFPYILEVKIFCQLSNISLVIEHLYVRWCTFYLFLISHREFLSWKLMLLVKKPWDRYTLHGICNMLKTYKSITVICSCLFIYFAMVQKSRMCFTTGNANCTKPSRRG